MCIIYIYIVIYDYMYIIYITIKNMEGLTPFFTMKNMEGLTRYRQILGYVLKDGTKAPRQKLVEAGKSQTLRSVSLFKKTIRYMVYNGYYKVMSNIPKMGHLTTPDMYQLCLKENDVASVFHWPKNCQDTWGGCQKNHDEKRGWEMPHF